MDTVLEYKASVIGMLLLSNMNYLWKIVNLLYHSISEKLLFLNDLVTSRLIIERDL